MRRRFPWFTNLIEIWTCMLKGCQEVVTAKNFDDSFFRYVRQDMTFKTNGYCRRCGNSWNNLPANEREVVYLNADILDRVKEIVAKNKRNYG